MKRVKEKDRLRIRRPKNGYALIQLSELARLWNCFQEGEISPAGFQVWFACFEAKERRQTYQSSLKKSGEPLPKDYRPKFTKKEISNLIGGGGETRRVSRGLNELKRAGLLNFSEEKIQFSSISEYTNSPALQNLLEGIEAENGSRVRPIPVPRETLRHLASGVTRSIAATILAHLFRAAFWNQKGCSYQGAVKASWISEVFGVCLRSVKSARKTLVKIGWLILKETPQLVLNRVGQWVQINPHWVVDRLKSIKNSCAKSAPPKPESVTKSAPPIKKENLPSGTKNQYFPPGAPVGRNGFLISKSKRRNQIFKRGVHLEREDLIDPQRFNLLIPEFRRRGWLHPEGLSDREAWECRERALQKGTSNQPGFFISLMKNRKLRSHISGEQERQAGLKMQAFNRENSKDTLSLEINNEGKKTNRVELSENATLVKKVIQLTKRSGLSEQQAFYVLKKKFPEWTRSKWDQALSEISECQREQQRRNQSLFSVSSLS